MVIHLALRLGVLAVLASVVVLADRNVTIDDQDSSILYSPPGAWSRSSDSALDSGGSHMLTQNPNATASFNFTGIAIYFLSPLWPYTVNTAISLDSGPVTLVELVDHSRTSTDQGPETVQSHVVWNATGLANTRHNLKISVGAGQPFGIVDGLIYTDTTVVTSSSTSSSPTATSTNRTVASSTSSEATDSSSKRVLPIALGTVFGILGLFLIMFAIWYFCRRRKRPISEAWTVDGSPVNARPPPPNGHCIPGQPYGGYPMNQTGEGSWQNPRYGYVGMPAPPIPAQASYTYHGGYSGNSTSPQMPPQPPPPQGPDRAPNRYQPGYTLSTITEKSTPQMGEGRTPLANSPASYQSDLGYYTAPASEGMSSTMSDSRQSYYGVQKESTYKIPDYATPIPSRAPDKTTQGKPSSGWT